MINKKIKTLYIKLIILVLCVLIISRIFVLVLSKYESISNSYANVDVAFYVFEEDYKTMTLNLGDIVPQENEYIYTFSIGNVNESESAEVTIEYDLKLRTTTNLPVTYELYMNEDSTDRNATNIIKENTIAKDEYGTYFRTMTTEKNILPYTEEITNVYQLVVHFPENYNEEIYQDIIEMIEISVSANQVTNE